MTGHGNLQQAYVRFVEHLRRQAHLVSVARLLEWDQATCMPPGAFEQRAEQAAILARLVHESATAPDFLDLVDELSERWNELPAEAQVDVREVKWRCDRLRRLPPNFVSERGRLLAMSRAAWSEARERDDFEILRPFLEEVVNREREFASYVGPDQDPYQVLLEEYEPGARVTDLDVMFLVLVSHLRGLLKRVGDSSAWMAASWPGPFPVAEQHAWNLRLLEWLGFDFHTGRLDQSLHPFSITVGRDHRITTRYDEQDLREGLFSTLHEAGHALYEQGLDPHLYGLPRGTACSLGVHESQSRLWENLIGRRESFWRFLWPHLRQGFPSLKRMGLDQAVRSVNCVRPSLIRTEADELTYNLHIVVRFVLERKLIAGELEVDDLPYAWFNEMNVFLGVTPQTSRDGVLQDVHWASGAFGYFPTYTLGNLYAAQLWEALARQVGDIDRLVSRGEFTPIRQWLQEHVYRWGQTYRPKELIARATGTKPTVDALLRHLEAKVAWIEAHRG